MEGMQQNGRIVSSSAKPFSRKASAPLILPPPKVNSHRMKEKQEFESAREFASRESIPLIEEHNDKSVFSSIETEDDAAAVDETLEEDNYYWGKAAKLQGGKKKKCFHHTEPADKDKDNTDEICEEEEEETNEPEDQDVKEASYPEGDDVKEASTLEDHDLKDSESASDIVILEREGPPKIIKKKLLPVIKLPVLLATVIIDLDIFDSYDLLSDMSCITKTEWNFQVLDSRVVLPSTMFFVNGLLVVDIEFVNCQTHTIHAATIKIPWQKVQSVDWLSFPEMPSTSREEFMFQSDDALIYHEVYEEHFVHELEYNFRGFKCIWNDGLLLNEVTPTFSLQGSAQLLFDILQPQYVNLNLI
ncbi:hypothetical protein [Bacillus sp. T33-2]|uniref:hypothetical protein n=1 Tax=Bacillus sp. T33-2 TaxID=2054168 RepID=UPI000C75B295|nr:hypothetical protein [Bacillus sp. T33-2]PLR97523.1 hypothetical protein CVD19_08540 [Bacillus sp. T33-2]